MYWLLLLLQLLPPSPKKYWIFFRDKAGAPAKTEATYLDPHARWRRQVRGTHVPRDLDRPLSPHYLQRLRALGIQPVVESRWLNAVSAYLTEAQLEAVERLPFVARLQPVARWQPAPLPHPPAKALETYGPSYQQLALINATAPLEAGYRGEGVRMGFLDTAFRFDHPALVHLVRTGRLVATYDFVHDTTDVSQGHPHGTMTSSVAVGYAPDTLIGPGHGASVLAAHTEYADAEINQEEDWFVAGMEWLERQGVDVVNVSLGYSTFDPGQRSYTYEDMDGDTAIPTIAADRAAQLGVVVVVSAGNEGCASPQQCWYYITSPADGDSVITVGAIRPDSTLAPFSSRGPTYDGRIKPDVVAPGVNVYTAYPPDGYVYASGTSFSAPLVSGVVAQLLQARPTLTPMEVRDILRQTASQARHPDNAMGWGIVNAGAALETVLALASTPEHPASPALFLAPNPARAQTTLRFFLPRTVSDLHLEMVDLLGRRVYHTSLTGLHPGWNARVLPLTARAAGVYLIRLTGTGVGLQGTILIQH